MDVAQFIQEYFINPLAHPESYPPYNPFNTLVYAAVAIVAVYALFQLFKRWNVKIDEKFVLAVLPFVVLGSAVRVIVDAQILPRAVQLAGLTLYPFVTPGIYILVAVLLVASLLFARFRQKQGGDFARELRNVGIALAIIPFLAALSLAKYWYVLLIVTFLAFFPTLVWSLVEELRNKRAKLVERLAIFSQSFDGAASFWAFQYSVPGVSYFEQHVLGNALIGAGGPILFLLVKIAFGIVAVELVRRYSRDAEESTFILLLITIMGLAPGLRDVLRLAAGV
ncbi:MAG TPA: DUF63 family protein [Candidatus Norongarragalinales archaeon]|jgi:uncharacterized membrane protein|nr:DUF63 family protein [Candidatus Norongarragalinales archaeon]